MWRATEAHRRPRKMNRRTLRSRGGGAGGNRPQPASSDLQRTAGRPPSLAARTDGVTPSTNGRRSPRSAALGSEWPGRGRSPESSSSASSSRAPRRARRTSARPPPAPWRASREEPHSSSVIPVTPAPLAPPFGNSFTEAAVGSQRRFPDVRSFHRRRSRKLRELLVCALHLEARSGTRAGRPTCCGALGVASPQASAATRRRRAVLAGPVQIGRPVPRLRELLRFDRRARETALTPRGRGSGALLGSVWLIAPVPAGPRVLQQGF